MKVPKPRKMSSGRWFIHLRLQGENIPITEETAEQCIAKAMAIKSGLDSIKKRPLEITLDQAITIYEKQRENVLSPSTIRGYEVIRKHRFPTLMTLQLKSITREKVRVAVNGESKVSSPKTVANSYGFICSVLKDYDIDVTGVKLPQKIKPAKKYLEADEIVALIDGARGDSCEIPIVMAAWLGMRRSEIVGLHWDDIDFKRKTLSIRHTMVPNKNNKLIEKAGAKNESSQRPITCPDYIINMLQEYPHAETNDRVFQMCPETILRHIHALCEKNGIEDTTTHGLRHANAAVMTSLSITDRCAMARGGWKTEYTFKQIYSYLFNQDQKDADTKINEFFCGKLEKKVELPAKTD